MKHQDQLQHPTTSQSGHYQTTRLAPSPTGALHLGNARTFLINWAIARAKGWKIVLRIEDLDGPRVKPGAIESTIDILRWLGMDWDSEPMVQSHDAEPYLEAIHRLAQQSLVYPCSLTRSQIQEANNAPHADEHEVRFNPSLRPATIPIAFDNPETSWRFCTGNESLRFVDLFAGSQAFSPGQSVGDFVVWTKRSFPAYQLAVVVDDARQGVTQIIRGDDLLDSTARQLMLYHALNLTPIPQYWHLPLVLGPDGRRLAKRHGDTRLDHYKSLGVPPERIIGLIASWCNITHTPPPPNTSNTSNTPRHNPPPTPMNALEFQQGLDPHTIDHQPVVFTAEDEQWLMKH